MKTKTHECMGAPIEPLAVPDGALIKAAQALVDEHKSACLADPMYALIEMAKEDEEALVSAALLADLFRALSDANTRTEFAQKQWDNWIASANDWKERAVKAEAERDTLNESLRLVNEDHGLWMARAHAAEDARDNALEAQMAVFKQASASDQAEFNRKWGAMKERAENAEARVKELEAENLRVGMGAALIDMSPNQIHST